MYELREESQLIRSLFSRDDGALTDDFAGWTAAYCSATRLGVGMSNASSAVLGSSCSG
jgi:hypothetical protein